MDLQVVVMESDPLSDMILYNGFSFMTLVQSGIAADTMRINGAIRQFKQVSHIIVA